MPRDAESCSWLHALQLVHIITACRRLSLSLQVQPGVLASFRLALPSWLALGPLGSLVARSATQRAQRGGRGGRTRRRLGHSGGPLPLPRCAVGP